MGKRRTARSMSDLRAKSASDETSHEYAMDLIIRGASMSTLSYEEAIGVYLRARGILNDGARILGAPIPPDWEPPRA